MPGAFTDHRALGVLSGPGGVPRRSCSVGGRWPGRSAYAQPGSRPARRNGRPTSPFDDETAARPDRSESMAVRFGPLKPLQRGQASARFDTSSAPPCCRGTMCSMWNRAMGAWICGSRQYSQRWLARWRTSSRTASSTTATSASRGSYQPWPADRTPAFFARWLPPTGDGDRRSRGHRRWRERAP